jgi:hypothetical protein
MQNLPVLNHVIWLYTQSPLCELASETGNKLPIERKRLRRLSKAVLSAMNATGDRKTADEHQENDQKSAAEEANEGKSTGQQSPTERSPEQDSTSYDSLNDQSPSLESPSDMEVKFKEDLSN